MNAQSSFVATLIALAVVVIVAFSSLFTVAQTEQALVLRFGDPVPGRGLVTEPGLHFKLPFIETVVRLDKRILDQEQPQQEILAHDSQRLIVDAFLRYKIVDPLTFYKTVRTPQGSANQLGSVLNSALRRVLGEANLTDIVRDRRDELMAAIRQQVDSEAAKIGVQVIDTRIRRADYPSQLSDGVIKRMQSERQREAAEYRAQGAEQSQTIIARANRDVTVLTADAQRQGDTTRGQGDAERNRIFAEAYGRDPGFFAFYRSMQAYEAALKAGTRLVISPRSDFFRYFASPAGTPKAAAVASAP